MGRFDPFGAIRWCKRAIRPQLRAKGRSIVEPAVKQLYRNCMLAVDRKLKPQLLALVAESKLIRVAAPTLYPAVKRAANDAAADLRAADSTVNLIGSIQVETAGGRLAGPGSPGSYLGIEADFADFPFVQTLGLSSYRCFGWKTPAEIPTDHYQRLRVGRALPMMVLEGGWASAGAGAISSSPARQSHYVSRHAAMFDAANVSGWMHLVFADVDLATWLPPLPSNLPLFATIGLADRNVVAKPAWAVWKQLFARPFVSA
jgi:hypothetical protein